MKPKNIILIATLFIAAFFTAYIKGLENPSIETEEAAPEEITAEEQDKLASEMFCFAAHMLSEEGKIDKAEELYKKAMVLYPENYMAYCNLGLLYTEKGEYSKAVECQKKLIKLKPDEWRGYFNLGVAYHYMGDKRKALEQVRKLQEMKVSERADELESIIKSDEQKRMPDKERSDLVYRQEIETQDMSIDGKSSTVYNEYIDEEVKVKKKVSYYTQGPDEAVQYDFPLKVGLKWDEECDFERDDNMYCKYVESIEDVTVPAGTFKDCYKIVRRTCPDEEITWYYPSLGIVKYQYHHHGTVINEKTELIKVTLKNS